MAPDTEYDARLFGSTKDDAFLVYEVRLKNWFPGNTENPGLPLDMNSDGYLDGKDTNWQVDGENIPTAPSSCRKVRYSVTASGWHRLLNLTMLQTMPPPFRCSYWTRQVKC